MPFPKSNEGYSFVPNRAGRETTSLAEMDNRYSGGGGWTFVSDAVKSDLLDFESIARDTVETIGPTGSAADNIWPALDGISASTLLLGIDISGSPNAAADMTVILQLFRNSSLSADVGDIKIAQSIANGATSGQWGGQGIVQYESNLFKIFFSFGNEQVGSTSASLGLLAFQ